MKIPPPKRFTLAGFLIINALCLQSQNAYYNSFRIFDSPWHVNFGDVDKDGIEDMIGVNGNSNNRIDIYRGNPKGTFTYLKSYEIPTPAVEFYKVMLAEFNEDGIPDIIAISEISGVVLLSDGPASYFVSINPPAGHFGTHQTLVEDFNEDGHQDLLLNMRVYLNNNGILIPQIPVFPTNTGGATAMDFDRDNHLDVVFAHTGIGTLEFFKGDGKGNFSLSYVKNEELFWIISHDFNNDGMLDIIGQNFNKQLRILFNSINSSFDSRISIPITSFDALRGIFDVDHDGKDDVIVSNDRDLLHRSILGNGELGAPVTFPINGPTIREISFRDVVGSEEPDIVVMSGFGVTKIFYHSQPPVIEASPLCLSEPVQFKSENLNYYDSLVWNFGDALSKSNISRITSPEHQYTTEGTYKISLVTFVAGSVSESLTKTIFLKKAPTLELGSDISICQGSSSTLTVDKGYIYSWSTGETSDKIVVSESGLYKVQVTNGQCIRKDSIQVIVLDVPVINFPTSIESCEPFVVLDVGNSEFDIEWSTGELSQIIEVRQSGAYKVKVTNGICSTERAIDVNLNGITNLQVSVEKDTVAYMERVAFSASANDVSEWQWDFGDGNFSSLQDPLHQFEFEGNYTVTLVATNLWGCQDSSILKLFASPYLFIPNVFTPNGDTVNDAFEIEYNGHDNGVLTIFSRWEKPIFQSKIGKPRWDGGNEASGTYYYYLSLGSKQYKGWITLVR